MIVGKPPFLASKKSDLKKKVLHGDLEFPEEVSEQAADLICRLMENDPVMRLGGMLGADEIKRHKFFSEIEWENVASLSQTMPSFKKDSPVLFKIAEKQAFDKLVHQNGTAKNQKLA